MGMRFIMPINLLQLSGAPRFPQPAFYCKIFQPKRSQSAALHYKISADPLIFLGYKKPAIQIFLAEVPVKTLQRHLPPSPSRFHVQGLDYVVLGYM